MASTPDEEASTSEFVSSIIQRQVSEPILPSVKAMHLPRGSYVKKQYSHSTPYSHMQNTIKFCGVNAGSLPFSIILESNNILPSCTSSAVNLVKESVVCDVDPPSTSSEAPPGREQPIIENVDNARSSHCPVIRPGPSLSCNYCWNTVDDQGRILRRKTKYHCPECQVNLCIVPCFHEYHERNVT